MTKIYVVLLLLCSVFFVSSPVMADPNSIELWLSCPDVSGNGPNTLSNFGWSIAGYGKESINGTLVTQQPYFTYGFSSGNFPTLISTGQYSNAGTQYDPNNGVVSCSYTSTGGYDTFVVTYQLTNGYGGYIASQTQNTIVINQYVGLI